MDSQTIVAPMTPTGVSAVAALRVSGSRVRQVVESLFGVKAAKTLVPRMANLGTARDPESGKLLDSLLYIYFESPNSYTGEEVLELYPHGNPLIVRDLLQAIRSIEGVRLAEPGEYTRRRDSQREPCGTGKRPPPAGRRAFQKDCGTYGAGERYFGPPRT